MLIFFKEFFFQLCIYIILHIYIYIEWGHIGGGYLHIYIYILSGGIYNYILKGGIYQGAYLLSGGFLFFIFETTFNLRKMLKNSRELIVNMTFIETLIFSH